MVSLVYSIDCLKWSYRGWNNHFDQCVVFYCWQLSFCREYLAGFCFAWREVLIGSSVKACSKSLFIFYISQCFFTAVFMSGRVPLYVSISGILFDVAWFFWFSRWLFSIVNVFEIFCCISFSLEPLSTNRFGGALEYSVKSFCVVHILFNLSACE